MEQQLRKGEYSEWNEGDYKNLRLHKAQEIINLASVSISAKLNFFGVMKYGYELWFDGINILFGEGMQKYSKEEYDKIIKLRDDAEKFIKENKICYESVNEYKKKGMVINNNNLALLKNRLREFEYEVKCCNDVHGLSTRNRDDDSDGL